MEQGAGGEVRARLEEVRRRIAAAARAAGRDPGSITLVAVSKAQPRERIEAALEAGQRVFGENYVQEAQARWPALRARFPDVELHLVGALQTNKARAAVALFDVIQTLDRPKLAHVLAKELARPEARTRRLLVEVNLAEEPQKAGVAPGDLDPFLRLCREELRLPVRGLMAIPPADEDVAPYAALLAKLAARHGLPEVSIGMSADFETAIAFGATIVRIGTAIFGERPPRAPTPQGSLETSS
ncbi:MAG: YggS family pyridoxal phosphate-dependent enzyme [Geminicoccaceae bacterium]|nr:YggS family pyridoxal phosphate-dependent enzyme [Geminicoccaceae bacterium]MDW8341494.1 YggS family pyridoxal phosphate-dependent enzyme [Geminicoccaceae bacterium]